jgi:hypothetical protein
VNPNAITDPQARQANIAAIEQNRARIANYGRNAKLYQAHSVIIERAPPIDCRRPSDAWATDRGNRGASRCRGYLRRRPHRAVGPAAMMDPSGFSTNELHKVRCFGV